VLNPKRKTKAAWLAFQVVLGIALRRRFWHSAVVGSGGRRVALPFAGQVASQPSLGLQPLGHVELPLEKYSVDTCLTPARQPRATAMHHRLT